MCLSSNGLIPTYMQRGVQKRLNEWKERMSFGVCYKGRHSEHAEYRCEYHRKAILTRKKKHDRVVDNDLLLYVENRRSRLQILEAEKVLSSLDSRCLERFHNRRGEGWKADSHQR